MPMFAIDPLIKLGEVERELAKVFRPQPDRKTIVTWIEDGTLEGKQIGRGDNWYVYESSLTKLIIESQALSQQKLAA